MAPARDRHPDAEELERYSLGDTAEEQCAWLEEHLLLCAACRERLRDYDMFVGAMRRAAAEWRAEHPPAFAVTLSTKRGMAEGAHAPARRPLDLKPDFTGLAPFPHYDLQVADPSGGQVVRLEATPAATRIPGLQPGAYSVRIYSPAGELLREYALLVAD